MKLGDTVQWTSQAAGSKRTKRGTIIEVVPPKHHVKSNMKGNGMWRDHESYVVRASVIDGSESQKKRTALYWPRVNQLQWLQVV